LRFRGRLSGSDSAPNTDPAGHLPQRSRRGEDQRKARTHATPAAPHRGFVSSIGRGCRARTAGEACPVHAPHPHASHPPRSANQHRTPARCPGPARPAHTGRTRCTSDARRTLRRNNRPRHAPAPATHARPQQPPRRQLPALPPPAAPAAASPRRMMALRHHAKSLL